MALLLGVVIATTPSIPVGGRCYLTTTTPGSFRGLLCCFDAGKTGDTSYLTIVRTYHITPPVLHKGDSADYSITKDSSGLYILNESDVEISVIYCLLKF